MDFIPACVYRYKCSRDGGEGVYVSLSGTKELEGFVQDCVVK